MSSSIVSTPTPFTEATVTFAPGSAERSSLKARLAAMMDQQLEIPVVVGEREIHTGKVAESRTPHDHGHLLGRYHEAGEKEVALAIAAAASVKSHWASMNWEDRAAIFLKAADLLAGPYRDEINAATMLCQSKTVFQAEIDAACELVDFWRFNVHFMEQLYAVQPESADGMWNTMDYRPLEGFVFAVSPFNFTSIAGNLPTAPAIMGNTVLWKPSSTQTYSAWVIMKVLHEAGLPAGVISFLPGKGAEIGGPVLASPDLAGIHFTGSTQTFRHLWRSVGENIDRYHSYPRLVGETGGKDFVFAHPSAHVQSLVTALVRGAFEYQGQKCSASSRCYIAKSVWSKMKDELASQTNSLKMGNPEDHENFLCAVIDKRAFEKITGYIEYAKSEADCQILAGGDYDKSEGWYIKPTVVVTTNPNSRMLSEEIFGPVVSIYVYPDSEFEKALELVDSTSAYSLTGAVFSTDREAVVLAESRLRHAAGNFYINDKPTGAAVGQQPFGGGRA